MKIRQVQTIAQVSLQSGAIFLRSNALKFIVIERRARSQEYLQMSENAAADPEFTRIDRDGKLPVLVKKIAVPGSDTAEVLCVSEGRKQKEKGNGSALGGHQLAERTEAHLFVSVLAYGVLACIEHRLRQAGDHRQWRTVREQMATHGRDTIILTDTTRETSTT